MSGTQVHAARSAATDASYVETRPRTKRPVALPVPENLRFRAHPQDINSFIEGIHPNMVFMVRAHLPGDEYDPSEIISNFVVYMKGRARESRGGMVRWLRYDPVRYPNMPYYRWFLTNLRFFCQQARKERAIYTAGNRSLSESDFEVTSMDGGTVSPDSVAYSQYADGVSVDPENVTEARVTLDRFRTFLGEYDERYRESHPHVNFDQAFPTCSLRLMDLMGEEATNTEIASEFGISRAAVMQWKEKMGHLARLWERDPDEARATYTTR